MPGHPLRRLPGRLSLRRLIAIGALLGAAALAQAAPPFRDDMAQRTLACTACHGEQGRAGPDGYYPRLAGKPAGYLYNQLLNFRDGRRHYGLMTHMVSLMSDAYLAELARYFAAMQVPYPPPAVAPVAPAPEALLRGEKLARQGDEVVKLPACIQCHGDRLMGTQPNVPALLGLPADYLMAQLGGWKTGQRKALTPDCMTSVVRRLSDADAMAVVTWLAAQPVPVDTAPAAVPPASAPPPPELRCGSAPLPGATP